jgi:hypothetical protein
VARKVFNERPLPAPALAAGQISAVAEDQTFAVIAAAKRRIKLDLSG